MHSLIAFLIASLNEGQALWQSLQQLVFSWQIRDYQEKISATRKGEVESYEPEFIANFLCGPKGPISHVLKDFKNNGKTWGKIEFPNGNEISWSLHTFEENLEEGVKLINTIFIDLTKWANIYVIEVVIEITSATVVGKIPGQQATFVQNVENVLEWVEMIKKVKDNIRTYM